MDKIIIFIDGNSGVGKTTLSKYIKEQFEGFEHINLDEFKKNKMRDLIGQKIDDNYYDFFIKNYYDQEAILKRINNEDKIILEGCFICTLDFVPDIIFFLKNNPESDKKVVEKMIQKNKNIEHKTIKIYMEHWNNIWNYYVKKYKPQEKADFTF